MKQSPEGRPWGGEVVFFFTLRRRCIAMGVVKVGLLCATYLLVENHVHTVRFDVLRKLAQEGEDVLYARRVRQPP